MSYIHLTHSTTFIWHNQIAQTRKKLSHANHCIYNRYTTLWNIKISCRYHSADTQQKPAQSKKLKIIFFEAQTWKIEPDEIQVSYDVTNLYPSIPIDKATDVILQQNKNQTNASRHPTTNRTLRK